MANTQAKFISLKTNKLIQFIVYSNLWISIGSAFLCWQIFILNGLEINIRFLFFVFFCTLFSYNFQRTSRIKKLEIQLPNSWVVQNKNIAYFILGVSVLGAIATVPIFNAPFSLFWIFVLGIVSGGYSYRGFRDVPYLKIILISASWGITCGILPFIISKNPSAYLIFMNFSLVFCYILSITIPFDIRDLEVDEKTKRTIPQILGVNKAKFSAFISLIVSIIIALFIFSPFQSFIYFVSSIFSGYLIYNSNKNKPDIYFSFFIDGHIIFQFILIFLICSS